MAPLVRRSWSPCGHTPVLYQRTRAHRKVSVIAALCVPPTRDRVHLYFRLHADANINGELVVGFLRQLHGQLAHDPMVLIWDRLKAHRARPVNTFLHDTGTIRAVFLPPYAPELNPIEYAWGYLKRNPLANYPCFNVLPLADVARHHGRSLQRQEHLLRSFIDHSPLSLCLK